MTIQSDQKTPGSQLAKGLKNIWQRHRQTVCSRVAAVADAISLLKINQLTLDLRRQAADNAHKLAGNLGTFGHSKGSEHARALELALQSSTPPSSEEIQKMIAHTSGLQTAIVEIAAAMDMDVAECPIEIVPSGGKGIPSAR